MAKDKEFNGKIIRMISPLKESDRHDWIKAIAEIQWGENPATIDIRKMNPSTGVIGGGISLNDEETNKLTNALLENDFGDLDVIEEAYNRKKNRLMSSDKES